LVASAGIVQRVDWPVVGGEASGFISVGALSLWKVGAKTAGELLDGQIRQSFPAPQPRTALLRSPARPRNVNLELVNATGGLSAQGTKIDPKGRYSIV
jgi:hypothetical protein